MSSTQNMQIQHKPKILTMFNSKSRSPTASPKSGIMLDKRNFTSESNLPSHFKSFAERPTNTRNQRIATMKRILTDRLQIDFQKDLENRMKTPQQKVEEAERLR